ncbi:hypothetical protein ACU4GD_00770 [Cupriavidus basilensis]
MLSFATRSKAVEESPQFSMGDQIAQPTRFENNPQYEPLKGYDVVERFRYPIWDARRSSPRRTSSSKAAAAEFLPRDAGNVMVPLGKLKPGLYIVEAIIGTYRAHTLLFVSDTVAITKSTGNGACWSGPRTARAGSPVAGASLSWTDGLGVLAERDHRRQTVRRNWSTRSPERSYAAGRGPAGGAFISENFYYDSEIYNTKLYAFTDRPLYRPGRRGRVKFVGRNFRNATESGPAAAWRYQAGGPRTQWRATGFGRVLRLAADEWRRRARFTLPAQRTGRRLLRCASTMAATPTAALSAGGIHQAAFRRQSRTGQVRLRNWRGRSKGKIQLRYPDGKPVKDARLSCQPARAAGDDGGGRAAPPACSRSSWSNRN